MQPWTSSCIFTPWHRSSIQSSNVAPLAETSPSPCISELSRLILPKQEITSSNLNKGVTKFECNWCEVNKSQTLIKFNRKYSNEFPGHHSSAMLPSRGSGRVKTKLLLTFLRWRNNAASWPPWQRVIHPASVMNVLSLLRWFTRPQLFYPTTRNLPVVVGGGIFFLHWWLVQNRLSTHSLSYFYEFDFAFSLKLFPQFAKADYFLTKTKHHRMTCQITPGTHLSNTLSWLPISSNTRSHCLLMAFIRCSNPSKTKSKFPNAACQPCVIMHAVTPQWISNVVRIDSPRT